MLRPIATTMPKRSVILPVTTPPSPKPSMVSVKASDAAPREAANSVCTTGSTTTTDHMPTLPIEPITTASGKPHPCLTEVRGEEGRIFGDRRGRARPQLRRPSASGSSNNGAILGMQMHRNRIPVVPGGPKDRARNDAGIPSRARRPWQRPLTLS